jgi:hypothetical protein
MDGLAGLVAINICERMTELFDNELRPKKGSQPPIECPLLISPLLTAVLSAQDYA